jgi:hypothetical protein
MDILCDIDGTIADCTHRLHWIQSKPKNWKAFFAATERDAPIRETIEVITALYTYPHHQIIFCTARNEENRAATTVWLSNNVGAWILNCSLYMRKNNDHREDSIVKQEMLDKIRLDGYNPTLVFDDRSRVVEMWRKNGIKCFQVAEGNF